VIPEGVVFDIGCKGGFHFSEEANLLADIPEVFSLYQFAHLAPLIQAGFETGFYHFHFGTVSSFMGMEGSQQLLVIFLKCRQHIQTARFLTPMTKNSRAL
jgi:hypothetical protein